METNLQLLDMPLDILDRQMKVCEIIARTDFCPTSLRNKPADVFICISYGREIGLSTMQSLQSICVINGKPSLYGDAMIALIRSKPECEYIVETFDDATMTATCRSKRVGQPESVKHFSWKDAEVAGHTKKSGPWQQHPKRMLQFKARNFNLRDTFADMLYGLITDDEAKDYPAIKENDITPRAANSQNQHIAANAEVIEMVYESTLSEMMAFAKRVYSPDEIDGKCAAWLNHYKVGNVEDLTQKQAESILKGLINLTLEKEMEVVNV